LINLHAKNKHCPLKYYIIFFCHFFLCSNFVLNPNLKAHKAWLISKYSIFYGFFPHNSRAFKNLVQKSKRGHFSSDWRAVIEWFATPNFIFIICISHFGLFPVYKMLLFGAFLLRPVRGVLQHGEERRVGEADDRHPHQHVLEPKLLDQSPTQSWTNSKAKTEGNIPNSIDPTIHRAVPEVHQVPQLGHHGAVHHANGKPKASHGDDELSWLHGKRYLIHWSKMILYPAELWP